MRLKRDNSLNDKEPVTGRCMTCDSTVRWPREVKVFRCVTCQTINDLEPFVESQKDQFTFGKYDQVTGHRKPIPVNVERTRSIIDRCVSDYLRSLLSASHLERSTPTPTSTHGTPGGEYFRPGHGHGHMRGRSGNGVPNDTTYVRPKTATSPRRAALPDRTGPPVRHTPPGIISRKPVPISSEKPLPPPPIPSTHQPSSRNLRVPEVLSGSLSDKAESDIDLQATAKKRAPRIFKPLETYIQGCLTGCASLNVSFMSTRPQPPGRAASESNAQRPVFENDCVESTTDALLTHLDPKMLLLGDIAENGTWWTGGRAERRPSQHRDRSPEPDGSTVSLKTPRINWAELAEWYHLIIHAGDDWKDRWNRMRPSKTETQEDYEQLRRWESNNTADLERDVFDARIHAQRQLLKATENLLKRPRQPLKLAEDCRFLMMLLANPLLYSDELGPSSSAPTHSASGPSIAANDQAAFLKRSGSSRKSSLGHHAGLIKRILGLISNVPDEVHRYITSWLSRFSDSHFQRLVDLVGGFVTYRLTRLQGQKRSEAPNPTAGLVPDFSGIGGGSTAQVHAALADRPTTASRPLDDKRPKFVAYSEDWQVRVAARVMSLLFKANTWHPLKQRDQVPKALRIQNAGLNAKHAAHSHGQILPTSAFYNTMLDYCDLVADFEAWESSRTKFAFCRYPFFLSIWAKIHIMEYDARRQMEVRAREAFFDSILTRKAVSQYLVLRVRRECLVEDSLRAVSEVVGSGSEDIKKGLKIDFQGEEGVDAGGLRKEWFLLLTREIFDPQHGLFTYDEDSNFCYFNPYCFESSEQFFLVGVLLGLAIYNSAILDVAFPPFAFKKLLASAPSSGTATTAAPRITPVYTLEDLAEIRPALARGLRLLLDYDGDVEEAFSLDFVAQIDRYGEPIQVPLSSGGEKKPVTNSNRREYVELYVRYVLDTAVARQYEPFKRGFFTVCGGNALSLFRPEEIELLIRGSEEPLDISALKAVATYENWHCKYPEEEPQVQWFWEAFSEASPKDQRKVLSFITGSDRIPAMGATNLVLKITCLGNSEDTERLPSARTCFNMLSLYRYQTREKLMEKLWLAVGESEGFGLK